MEPECTGDVRTLPPGKLSDAKIHFVAYEFFVVKKSDSCAASVHPEGGVVPSELLNRAAFLLRLTIIQRFPPTPAC
jgi:hypothetical protein